LVKLGRLKARPKPLLTSIAPLKQRVSIIALFVFKIAQPDKKFDNLV